jgi:multiple sugar transport system ATP-binding protein
MAHVHLKNVRKVYPNGYEAVKDFSLDIPDGEFVVLVGPSGCGKSTTLRMVAGLEDASSGSIDIGGRVVNDVHPKDRDIAMVFQNYALYPHMSVYKNMAFALKLRRVPKDQIEQRVMQAAKMLGIEELLERKPRALSGGQRQRVAVGRAIVREPKAFLFDEPLSNLDAKLRVTTRAELKQLHHRLKTTTIYVTHDQEEAMTLGDRIVVMSKGLIQQQGPPLEVYRRPVNRFVAAFVGTPPMNFIEGSLQGDGSSVRFVENGAGGLSLPVAAEHAAALRPHAGKSVALGVRPQAILDRAAPGYPANIWPTVDLPVRVVEPLGDTMDVFTTSPCGAALVARVHARQGVASGGTLGAAFKMDECHYFETGEFGRSLLAT